MSKSNVSQTFKGTRDISGDEMRWRLQVLEKIREVFVLFGFEPLETPAIERRTTLTGKYGEDAEHLLFMLAKPFEEGGLRYDHTVPLARFAAANWPRLSKPYKRYAIGPVFRGENPQSGRYRQFYQCDFDTLGSDSLAVDAEIVAINYTVLTSLGFDRQFAVHLNDRRLLNAMVKGLGFETPAQVSAVLRGWDKLDKSSLEEVQEYLSRELAAQGADPKQVSETLVPVTAKMLEAKYEPAEKMVNILRASFTGAEFETALGLIEELLGQIESLGVPKENYRFNPLLARGLSYYTGPIFETVVEESGIGSVTGGGRFDNLIEAMGGPSVPASGSSFGLDRLLDVMGRLGLKPESSQTTKVFVAVFDSSDQELTKKTLGLAGDLRASGVATEVYTGNPVKLGRQISLASEKNIPLLVILGPDEAAAGVVKLRVLATREERTVETSGLFDEVVKYLS